MDVSKTRLKYKPEIQRCLCFSVMGQRRFRISMGALIASPEAGDASVNIIPQMKKYSVITDDRSKSFVSTMSENDSITQNVLRSTSHNDINIMNKSEYEEMLMINNIFDETSSSTIHNNCQFPYYRSSKNIGQFPDAVLVKDVGVSCMLLNHNIPEISIPEANNYLVKQLKKEYNDLSNITSKITAYTKNILNYLSKKNQRKNRLLQNLESSKHAIVSQNIDNKGNLCLKLRLISDAETQCRPKEIVKEADSILFQDKYITWDLYNKHCNYHNYFITNLKKNFNCMYIHVAKNQITHQDQIYDEYLKLRQEKEVQTIFSGNEMKVNTSNSSSHSTSSIYNYVIMKPRKSSTELLKSTLINFGDPNITQNSYKGNGNKNRKEHLKRCNPVIFTNWREISKLKQFKNKELSITPDKSRRMTDTNEKILKDHLFDSNMNNNLPNSKFHTVNVRIVKHKRKHV
ncbi:uncharacterized protein LOC143348241 [Colletes latitarsis]|uniref:uncharacterized protein LOC143348241 n=1 Tax=Colletes latitarsis TaxID=2605962 RepID=UPI00403562FC